MKRTNGLALLVLVVLLAAPLVAGAANVLGTSRIMVHGVVGDYVSGDYKDLLDRPDITCALRGDWALLDDVRFSVVGGWKTSKYDLEESVVGDGDAYYGEVALLFHFLPGAWFDPFVACHGQYQHNELKFDVWNGSQWVSADTDDDTCLAMFECGGEINLSETFSVILSGRYFFDVEDSEEDDFCASAYLEGKLPNNICAEVGAAYNFDAEYLRGTVGLGIYF